MDYTVTSQSHNLWQMLVPCPYPIRGKCLQRPLCAYATNSFPRAFPRSSLWSSLPIQKFLDPSCIPRQHGSHIRSSLSLPLTPTHQTLSCLIPPSPWRHRQPAASDPGNALIWDPPPPISLITEQKTASCRATWALPLAHLSCWANSFLSSLRFLIWNLPSFPARAPRGG